jgi:transcriptional regulator with XRE-family HTH domain
MMTAQDLTNILGKNIKKLRERNGWSQEFLAEKVDVTTNTISVIETGKKFTTAETLVNLAIAFNTDVYELFKPEGVLPDKPSDIIARYTEEIKVTVGKIGNVYIENMRGEKS